MSAVAIGMAFAVAPAVAAPGLADGASVSLVGVGSGKCVDVLSGSTADGAGLAQYDCHAGLNQLWRVRDVGGGQVELVARHSGKCLDVSGAATANGSLAVQWTCTGGANQRWRPQDAGNGQVVLLAQHSGKCLDIAGGSTANGARLHQWDCHGGSNQKWTATVKSRPALPGLFADPNLVVFGDTYYLYPTTDGFPGWSGTQFRAFSSKDLVHWTDHGVILDVDRDVSWADNSAWAPTIAARNGKYYFYFSAGRSSGDTRKHIGVAVADSPTGPFVDALGAPMIPAGVYSGQTIDPAVFTDDDGRPYLYWGQGYSHQVPLNADMVSFDSRQVRTYQPTGYNEGSFVVKRDGRYYFMWSENDTRSEDYRVAYATGPSPTGPWSGRVGTILQKDLAQGIKGTGHHSVVRAPGTDNWYIAYHRFAIPDGDGTHRETMVDRMSFNADGSIRPVTPTLVGVEGRSS